MAYTLRRARECDRDAIYRLRHAVYASELQQYPEHPDGVLTDTFDATNEYILAENNTGLLGFISITPPHHAFKLATYVPPHNLHPKDTTTYEARVLTVRPDMRREGVAMALMYAALRRVQEAGGKRIVIGARDSMVPAYERLGYVLTGAHYRCGAVVYRVMTIDVDSVPIARVAQCVQTCDWKLPFPASPTLACYHGGAVFQDHSLADVPASDAITADVLDAWFPPSPKVLAALADLGWVARTSPPTHAEELRAAVARCRGVLPANIILGAGSSDLMYRCLPHWLSTESKVLLLKPTYGEYEHICTHVIRCTVRTVNTAAAFWALASTGTFDVVFVVNPNNPTGDVMDRPTLEQRLATVPTTTKVWIDETYMPYVVSETHVNESIETLAVTRPNLVVCASMSKAYALSGLRCAYLCGAPNTLDTVRPLTPPWVVSMPAQIAALAALQDPEYYTSMHVETVRLRTALMNRLRSAGFGDVHGCANFVTCKVPDAPRLVAWCRERSVYVRVLDATHIRVAVVAPTHTDRLVHGLQHALLASSSKL